VAVVCLSEPDAEVSASYFDCKKHSHRPWLVPAGYMKAAKDLGYTKYKIPTCPKKFIWRSTINNYRSAVMMAAIRYSKSRLVGGGVLNQPAHVGQLVEIARNELRAFRQLRSTDKSK
jgi:hypothetical protein